jgi:hypothetical protein
MRPARAAAFGSCVTITMVLPSSRLQTVEQVQHLLGRVAVQVAGRLVGHDQRRVGHQGPGNGDALLLAAD